MGRYLHAGCCLIHFLLLETKNTENRAWSHMGSGSSLDPYIISDSPGVNLDPIITLLLIFFEVSLPLGSF